MVAAVFQNYFYSQTSESILSDQKLSFNYKNTPLREVLNEIREKSGLVFVYNDQLINEVQITGFADNQSIPEIFGILFNKHEIAYEQFEDNSVVLYKSIKTKKRNKEEEKEITFPEIKYYDNAKIVKPILISKNSLQYPKIAVASNYSGEVELRVVVNKTGDIEHVVIKKSSGYEVLDNSAIDYAKKLKYLPAQIGDTTITIGLDLKIRFQLDT